MSNILNIRVDVIPRPGSFLCTITGESSEFQDFVGSQRVPSSSGSFLARVMVRVGMLLVDVHLLITLLLLSKMLQVADLLG